MAAVHIREKGPETIAVVFHLKNEQVKCEEMNFIL